MSGLPAVPDGGRVVNVCCGDHRAAADCLCCFECPTGVSTAELDPAIRALLARDARERRLALCATFLRAEHAVEMADYWDLFRATAHAVRVLPLCFPHLEGSLA